MALTREDSCGEPELWDMEVGSIPTGGDGWVEGWFLHKWLMAP